MTVCPWEKRYDQHLAYGKDIKHLYTEESKKIF